MSRLGRGAQHGRGRQRRARPAIGLSVRRRALFRRAAEADAIAAGQVPARRGSTRWRGASCARCSRTGVVDHPVREARRSTCAANAAVSRRPMPSRRRCCSRTTATCCRSRADVRSGSSSSAATPTRACSSGGGSSLVYPRGGNAVPGLAADRLAGAGDVFPVIADASDPGAGAGRDGDLRRRQGSRRRGAAPRQAPTSRSSSLTQWTSEVDRHIADAARQSGRADRRGRRRQPEHGRDPRNRRPPC